MATPFFDSPIRNSPYNEPDEHWVLDKNGRPTGKISPDRRASQYFTPIPKSRKKRKGKDQGAFDFDGGEALSTKDQELKENETIMAVRNLVGKWRRLPEGADWKVTPTTRRLLQWWRREEWRDRRPFFCQVEAAEVMVWLTEVAPRSTVGRTLIADLKAASDEANPGLDRVALKLATGAGKTTVMAMLIAWQTLNAVASPTSKKFTRGFLLVAPGITIRDRLRVLMPNDPNNYYDSFGMVPQDLMPALHKARVVITNYHSFKLRERLSLSAGTRKFLKGRGEDIPTLETPGQMIQRVMSELMGLKNIIVINDEAHHCYKEKPTADEDGFTEDDLKGDEKSEAKEENEAARLWLNGLLEVQKKLGISQVIDLSATPFFLKGSGYPEGVLFPWTASDFSLMDAIECGIVKLPRVPVADNIPGAEEPIFRNLWDHIGKKLPKKGRNKKELLDPLGLPIKLETALEALYGNYEQTFKVWQDANISVPPCFIVVCNNTATSKLVYDYISGFWKEDGTLNQAKFPLFSNYDDFDQPYGRPRTLLIDSKQLESGDALDSSFREMASDEIERFRREITTRTGQQVATDDINEADLLREVMNTVGEKGKLGESIRCVVSVSMLTEGWDANNVTHILGVRAFGTQLLCEQVIGRALRRQSYDLNEKGHFDVEYADVLGIPFEFASESVIAKPTPPVERLHVHAVSPDRDDLEINFPRVIGYRVAKPPRKLKAKFNDDDRLIIRAKDVGATDTLNAGIVGEEVNLNLEHTENQLPSRILYRLTSDLIDYKYKDADGYAQGSLFRTLRPIVKAWLKDYLDCREGTFPAQLAFKELSLRACDRINNAITRAANEEEEGRITAILAPYTPTGSTRFVNFKTTKAGYETRPDLCPINYAVIDSGWEGEFARIVEKHPKTLRYVKNQALGFEVPYLAAGNQRKYTPDFIVLLDDGHGPDDPLQLVVEVKGYRNEDVKDKSTTMREYWVPGVNALKAYGRWAFAEFQNVETMETEFAERIERELTTILDEHSGAAAGAGGGIKEQSVKPG